MLEKMRFLLRIDRDLDRARAAILRGSDDDSEDGESAQLLMVKTCALLGQKIMIRKQDGK